MRRTWYHFQPHSSRTNVNWRGGTSHLSWYHRRLISDHTVFRHIERLDVLLVSLAEMLLERSGALTAGFIEPSITPDIRHLGRP